MRKWIALVLTLTVILTMSACKGNDPETPTQTPTVAPTVAPSEPTTPDATDPTVPDVTDPTVPDVTDPDENEDLVYDMADYQWLYQIFEKKKPRRNGMPWGDTPFTWEDFTLRWFWIWTAQVSYPSAPLTRP